MNYSIILVRRRCQLSKTLVKHAVPVLLTMGRSCLADELVIPKSDTRPLQCHQYICNACFTSVVMDTSNTCFANYR
jgi:hypothetical protein